MPSAYVTRARVGPAALLIAPLAALLGLISLPPAGNGALGLGTGAAVAWLLADAVADRGRRLQVELFTRWGGAPTSRLLWLSGASPPDSVDGRRRAIERAASITLPTVAAELSDADSAMRTYDDAIETVRSTLREDQSNTILGDTNASYGARRNLLACRDGARIIALASAFAAAAITVVFGTRPKAATGIIAADAALLAFWQLQVSEAWVKDAADRYATQFFQTLHKYQTKP